MKTTLTYTQQGILFILLLMQFGALHSCHQIRQNREENDIPALKIRHDALGSAEEAEAVLSTYDQYSMELRENPDNAEAALVLAELFMQEARVTGDHGYYFPAAANLLEGLLKRNDLDEGSLFQAHSLYAGVMASQHRFDVALEHAEKAIRLNRYQASVRGVQVDALVELGRLDEAVSAVDAMVALRPDLKSYSRIAYLRELHGDLSGATEAMRLAASAGAPGSEAQAWCRTQLAMLLLKTGQSIPAEIELTRTLEERLDYPFALAAMAELKMQQNEPKEAERLLNKALSIIPEIGFAEQLLALYKETGRVEEAAQMQNEVLAMFEDDRTHGHIIHWDLAQFHATYTGNLQIALREAEEALAQRPEHSGIQELIRELKAQQANLANS